MRKLALMLLALCLAGSALATTFTPELVTKLNASSNNELIRVIITMTDQVDANYLFDATAAMNKVEKRQFVLNQLNQTAEISQASVMAYLRDYEASGKVEHMLSVSLVNIIQGLATPEVIRGLMNFPEIAEVTYDPERYMLDDAPKAAEPIQIEQPKVDNTDEIAWGVADVHAPEVWAQGYHGAGVIVGMLDTGVNYNHLDLTTHMWDGGTSYPYHGYDFYNNDNNPIDDHGHGSHTAGSVASNGAAGTQAGVAPQAIIMAIKVWSASGNGSTAQMISGADFAVQHGADIFSMSGGIYGGGTTSDKNLFRAAYNNALAAGVIGTITAGNEAGLTPPSSVRIPGSVPPPWLHPGQTLIGGLSCVVTCGATQTDHTIASFSSRGPVTWSTISPWLDYAYNPGMGLIDPDVSAPGVDIKSCLHTSNTGYQLMSGTSMATPHVAGAIALMLEKNPNLTPAQIDQYLEMYSTDLGAVGKDNIFGAGLMNILNTINAIITNSPYSPAAPTNFTVANNGTALTASLSWTLPTTMINGNPLNPNHPILSVKIERDNVLVATLAATATSYNNNVPAPGQYAFKVYAANDSGNGLPANGSGWIGLDVPAVPTNVLAAVAGLQVNVSWTAPTAGQHGGYWPAGSWTGQKVYRNGTLVTTLPGTNTTYVDTPPVEGDYVYGVAYYNASGDGPTGNAPSVHAGPVAYIATPTGYSWIEINPNQPGYQYTGTNTGLSADDQNLGPFNLGFTYGFYGNNFTSFRVCSNGFATFNSTMTSYSNLSIPSTSAPFNLLAIYWDDLNMSAQGTAWYYADAANNRCIIEWDNVAHYGSTPPGNYTMEIIVYESGNIEYQYKSLTPGTLNSATVGIQNATGTTGLQCSYNGVGPIVPVARSGIRFAPPGGQPTWDVSITPINPPITIPANGGSFQYNISVHNLGAVPATCFLWNKVRNGANYFPVFGPISRTLPGGANPARVFTQTIASTIPSGTCYYISYIGPNLTTIDDSSYFTFTKSAVADGGPWISESYVTGDLFDEYIVTTNTIPNEYALGQNYPNPFNPLTSISFNLPQAGLVKLTVFDVMGRQVATLVNGMREAGAHSVTFDATNLASGVYLYKLEAGDYSAVQKMVLMK
ncbi:MAG: S8 family serine peptidase [bacterium]|nr:S8 family serine peptidase [bacterium]